MGLMNDLLTNDLFPQALQPIMLSGPTDLEGFRHAARYLLAQNILPEQVAWHSTGSATQDLFAQGSNSTPHLIAAHIAASGSLPPISVPPEFMTLCQSVVLHSDPNRFSLLYRLLWRMAHEPDLRHDKLDADMLKAEKLAQAVRRDMHKMKAFVRFRTVQDEAFRSNPEGGLLHVAWFEPEHHIVEAVAPFFARRFTQMRWAILTPERCMAWDGAHIRFSPGAEKSDAPPPDAGEALWLTYYQHTFNPARLKLKMMQKEMPRRYWHNLPEAQFISTLSASANQRQAHMMAQAPSTPERRIPAFKVAGTAQQALQI